jgi:hypothetical protein
MKPAVTLVATLALLALAACARDEDASVRPAESNDSYSAVERVGDNEGDEQTPALGEWRRSLQQDQPALEFGPVGTPPLITIVCGERGGLVLQRPGPLPPGSAPTVTVTIAGQGRQLPVTVVSAPTPMQRAPISAGDTLLTQLVNAQEPIFLRFGDGTPLVLPPSPLIAQFAQGCATGQHGSAPSAGGNDQAAAAAAPAGNASNGAATR